MSFPRYPEYKDSGVDWLGDLPSHWGLVPLKYLVRFVGGGTPDKSNHAYWVGDIPWLSPKDMRRDLIRDTRDKISETALSESSTCMIPAESVVLVFRSGILRSRIPVAVTVKSVALNQDMKALVGFPCPFYLMFLIQSHSPQLLHLWRQQGATVESLEYEQVANTAIPVPPRAEQIAITAFLTHETARIDALIEEQQRLIELLKEKRQAVISHAVTKGLDPNAPMKDSGVEWLGKVPEHWDVVRIGSLYREAVEPGDPDLPVLRVSIHHGVSDRELSEEESNRKITRIQDRAKYKRVRPGDLTYNMMRAWQGAFGAVSVDGLVSPAYVVARPYSASLSPFLERQLRTPNGVEEMRRNSYGITDFRLRLYWDQWKDMYVAVPPEKEHLAICDFASNEDSRTNSLIEESEQVISLLKERRSALISAAVTGKIDVRNWRSQSDTADGLPMAAEAPATYEARES